MSDEKEGYVYTRAPGEGWYEYELLDADGSSVRGRVYARSPGEARKRVSPRYVSDGHIGYGWKTGHIVYLELREELLR